MKINNFFNKIVLSLSATLIFYFVILLFSDIRQIDLSNLDFKLEYYPLIIAILFFHTLISNFRFYRLLHKLQIKISFVESLKIFMAGMSLGLTPGGIGVAIKCYILKNEFGKPITTTIPIIFVERLTELIGILAVLVTLNFFIFSYESIIVSIIGISFVVVFFMLISRKFIFSLLSSIFNKVTFFKKFIKSIDDSNDSFKQLINKKTIFESGCYSIISKFLYLLAIYLIFLSFGIDLGIISSGMIYYTSLLIGALSMIPSGIIITETSMLAMLLQHKVELSIATLLTITLRIISTWTLTISGTIIYVIFYRRKNK